MHLETNYFVKEGYLTNSNIEPVLDFWNPQRIVTSAHFQYYVYKYAVEIMERLKFKSIIDVGCGVGTKLKMFRNRGWEVHGLDSEPAIEYCRKHYSFATFSAVDLEAGDFKLDRKFDLIVCADVIEHMENPNNLLRLMLGLATQNSRFLISTPNRDALRGKDCFTAQGAHIREWNVDELEKYLASIGISIVERLEMLPVKFGINRIFYNEVLKRLILGKPVRTNQVLLCKVASEA